MALVGQIKDTCLLGLFNVALPSSDTYTDIFMVVQLLMAGHIIYGCSFLGPFLVNYLSNAWDWFKNGKDEPWIALLCVLLNCYPQYKGN